jgi:hypothetical protein
VLALAFLFANVEIQIEGTGGWAANLPTWRIEHHWLLDMFLGGRAMTGYHAWVFSFIFLVFHFPMIVGWRFTLRDECHAIACLMMFWIVEDFLWFVVNPAFGIGRFTPFDATWHKHWLWHAPVEYWVFLPIAVLLFNFASRVQPSALND